MARRRPKPVSKKRHGDSTFKKLLRPLLASAPRARTAAERADVQEFLKLPSALRRSISSGWRGDVPAIATALYGRWWQIDTWLRSLVYVELRTNFGPVWVNEIPSVSEDRQLGERTLQHMPTPDIHAR